MEVGRAFLPDTRPLRTSIRSLNSPTRNDSHERPYGIAWFLQLTAELREWDDPRARAWLETLMPLEQVREQAKAAKAKGSSRFCMGAAWRNPRGRNFERVLEMVERVRDEGLETCLTLGMLDEQQTRRLKDAGLDYYNHNLDTSPEFYGEIITTRNYRDRLDTIQRVRDAGINVCCGGIVGMGETRSDRVSLMQQLARQKPHPESVPVNLLVRVEGTPLAKQADLVLEIAAAHG